MIGGETILPDRVVGQRSALIAAYLEQRPRLVRFFTLRAGSANEAEDIVQEIYLKIAGVGASEIENPGGFLYRLGTNLMLDRVRSRRRAAARDGAYAQVFNAPGGDDVATDAPSPEDAWEARATLKQVLGAVEHMPSRRRRVFVMHKLKGASYAEIAAELGITRSAVEKLMTAAFMDLAVETGIRHT